MVGWLSRSQGAGAAWECQRAAATSEFWENLLKTKVCWHRFFFLKTQVKGTSLVIQWLRLHLPVLEV